VAPQRGTTAKIGSEKQIVSLYTALCQAFPRATLTNSQQEKEDEQTIFGRLHGVVFARNFNVVRAAVGRTDGRG
jgi:hypothetical protein